MKARTAAIALGATVSASLFALLVVASAGDPSPEGIPICPEPPTGTDLLFWMDYNPLAIVLFLVLPVAFSFALLSNARSVMVRTERTVRRRL